MSVDLDKLKEQLEEIDKLLTQAISNLGQGVGGIKGWAGSWGEYQRLVKTKLKLEVVNKRCAAAIRRRNKDKWWEENK